MNRNNPPMGRILALLLPLLLSPAVSLAQAPPQVTAEEARKQEARASWQAAIEAATKGQAVVPLVGEAHLTLPRDMIFVPPAQAARMLRAWGNKVSSEPTGLIIGMRDEDEWVIVLRFIKEGYIKEDDAKEWNANELLSSIREGNEAANEDRRARGFSEVEIIGWIAPPAYDTVTHRLVSSIAQRQKDAPAGAPRPTVVTQVRNELRIPLLSESMRRSVWIQDGLA